MDNKLKLIRCIFSYFFRHIRTKIIVSEKHERRDKYTIIEALRIISQKARKEVSMFVAKLPRDVTAWISYINPLTLFTEPLLPASYILGMAFEQ